MSVIGVDTGGLCTDIPMLEDCGSSTVISQSVYIHEKLQLVLVVYVDDFKMAGLAQGWSMLRTRLKIEPETGLDMYLGCHQSKGSVTLGMDTASLRRPMTWDSSYVPVSTAILRWRAT